jgi:hypothetical protein
MLQIYDMGQAFYFSSEGRIAEDFFRPEKSYVFVRV